jgi:hypothetical protein
VAQDATCGGRASQALNARGHRKSFRAEKAMAWPSSRAVAWLPPAPAPAGTGRGCHHEFLTEVGTCPVQGVLSARPLVVAGEDVAKRAACQAALLRWSSLARRCLPPAEDQTSILAAEAEGVGESDVHLGPSGLVRHAVQVAVGVRMLVVDGGV